MVCICICPRHILADVRSSGVKLSDAELHYVISAATAMHQIKDGEGKSFTNQKQLDNHHPENNTWIATVNGKKYTVVAQEGDDSIQVLIV